MDIEVMRTKIHRATVTEADLHYQGSITIDRNLLEKAGLYEYEKVQVLDINNGERLETYTIEGQPGSGTVCLNGAAARRVEVGDKVIIIAYTRLSESEAEDHAPRIVHVDNDNVPTEIQ